MNERISSSIPQNSTHFANNMVDWVTVIVSVGFSVVGSLIVTEYQVRREQSVEESAELEAWYGDSASYASQVRRTWQRLFDDAERPGMNLSEIQSEMSLLEGQISRHASMGEQLDADQTVIAALDTLAVEVRRPDERSLHSNSFSEFEVLREEILAAVSEVEDALANR